jgi:HD-like signal output (HDOD) protein
MPRHILLVGDESQRLHAPQLLPRAQQWQVSAAQGCDQALRQLERQPPDVVVADMDVLDPEGVALLLTVGERWPGVSRIALSELPDYPNQSYEVRAPVAHQYISWERAPAELNDAIERCLGIQDLLSQPELRALIGTIRHLPPRPRIFTRLQVMLSHRNVTPKKVCAVIEADVAITAKVLQLANCAYFHNGERITSVEQAIVRVGFHGIRNLVMCSEVMACWTRAARSNLDLEAMQAHVQRVARVTAALTAGHPCSDEAVLAAFLHDIGYWVLRQERPAQLDQAAELALTENILMHEAERRVLGTCHAQIGAYLLGLWGMPSTLVEAVAYHHAPERAGARRFTSLAALAVAHALSGTDDGDAFASLPRRDAGVGHAFLDPLEGRPFSWGEAEKTAMACLAGPDPLHTY